VSTEDCTFALSAAYDRATRNAAPCDIGGIRRAFRRAFDAAGRGDARPTVLLTYRYP
jgi:hypothetical protein